MTTIITKIYFENEIRKVKLTTKTNYQEFLNIVLGYFQKKDMNITTDIFKNYKFSYTDSENDVITFSSEEEWTEAIKSVNGILKIRVTSINSKERLNNKDKSKTENKCEFNFADLMNNFQQKGNPLFNFINPYLNQEKENVNNQENKNQEGKEMNFNQILNFLNPMLNHQETKNQKENNQEGKEMNFDQILNFLNPMLNNQKENKEGKENNFDFMSFLNPIINNQENQKENQEGKENPFLNFIKSTFVNKENEKKQEVEEIKNPDDILEEILMEEKEEKIEKEKPENKYENEIEYLKNMGFVNSSLNLLLLKKYNGKIELVVEQLLKN
jgi:hypothetical protein